MIAVRRSLSASQARSKLEVQVRAESDLEGPDRGPRRSQTHDCEHCGLPLLGEADFCPYCERWQDDSGVPRVLTTRSREGTRRFAGLSERMLLAAGVAVFTIVAAASVVAVVLT